MQVYVGTGGTVEHVFLEKGCDQPLIHEKVIQMVSRGQLAKPDGSCRGRVVVPLIGKGITTDNLGEIATFLTGPCSCQVKALNPGVDLLMNCDWQSAVLGED